MSARSKSSKKVVASAPAVVDQWPGIDSHFRLIIVAALRSKQLMRGSIARIEPDPLRRRNTTIALEEVKRGLVPFALFDKDQVDADIESAAVA